MRPKETQKWLKARDKATSSTLTKDRAKPSILKKRKLSETGDLHTKAAKDPLPESLGTGNAPRVFRPSTSNVADISLAHHASGTGVHFPYKPLDNSKLEIRVVILKPGPRTSIIECALLHVTTGKGSRPSYKALSYTWGSPEIQKTILLDDMQVQVRENLWQALYHLRSEEKLLRLWIDALCIDQDNVTERNQQVSRMGTLYSLAEEVLVWLGPADNGSEQALEFIEQIVSSRAETLSLDSILDPSLIPYWEAVEKLTKRNYWERAWIIQEIFRARKVSIHCGNEKMPLKYLAKLLRDIRKLLDPPDPRAFPSLMTLGRSLAAKLTDHRTSHDHDLESLLRTYKYSLCQDPRDKVYSLLGLAGKRISVADQQKSRRLWIPIDYAKSAQELFEYLALLYYEEDHFTWKIDILPEPDQSSVGVQQVRRMQLLQGILKIKPSEAEAQCLKYSDTGAEVPVLEAANQKLTCTTGFVLKITGTSPTWSNGVDLREVFDWYTQFDGVDMPSMDAFKDTLKTLDDDDLARLRSSPRIKSASTTMDKQNSSLLQADLRMFMMQNGRVGLTACEICKGDVVARFSGCDVAVIMEEYGTQVKGRAFVFKSDKKLSRGMGLASADAAAFKYGVPDVLDIDDANLEVGEEESISPGKKLILTLKEWQFLTW